MVGTKLRELEITLPLIIKLTLVMNLVTKIANINEALLRLSKNVML